MIGIPKSPPIDIRALILYDNSQWKTPEKSYNSYEKLCETSGNVAISYEDYEYYFNEYLKEAYYSARNKSELLTPDIRCCILSDVIHGKPTEKSLNDLCEAFGFVKINKEDHGYWYKRYKYTRHPSTPLQFSDLPIDVVSEIVEKCDLETHLKLRNVSYGIRTVVDQNRPACTKLYTVFVDYGIGISHDFLHLLDPRGMNQQQMFRELEFLLRNPKLRLKQLCIKTVSRHVLPGLKTNSEIRNYKKHFFDLLNSLHHQIHVENCSIDTETEKESIGVLQCLNPGIVQKLAIRKGLRRHSINRIVRMDHWKQAEHLELYGFNLPSIEHLFHFTTIETGFETTFSVEDLVLLCNGLSKSINFESCTMKTRERLDTDAIKEALNLQETTSPGIYSIPNSNLVIEFSWGSRVLKLSKYSV